MNLKMGLLLSLTYISISISAAAQPHTTAAHWLKASDLLECDQLSADEKDRYCLNACKQMVKIESDQDSELLHAIEGFLSSHWHHLAIDQIKEACNEKIKSVKRSSRQVLKQSESSTGKPKLVCDIPTLLVETWSGQVQVFDERKSQIKKSSSIDYLETKKHLGQVLEFSEEDELKSPQQTTNYDDQFQDKGRHLYDEIEFEKSNPAPSPHSNNDWDFNSTPDAFEDQFEDYG